MGNSFSQLSQHLYVLKVSNQSLPVCPFLHTVIRYNGLPVSDVDPRIFREILRTEDLSLDIMDLRNRSTFTVRIPRGTAQLGINVIRIKGEIKPFRIQLLNAREDCQLRTGDRILGVENVYLANEQEFIDYVKSHVGDTIRTVLVRDGRLAVQEVEAKDDMGCELGIGVLHRVPPDEEYFNEIYDGSIRKERAMAGKGERSEQEAMAGKEEAMAGKERAMAGKERAMAGKGEQIDEQDTAGKEDTAGEQPRLTIQEEPASVCQLAPDSPHRVAGMAPGTVSTLNRDCLHGDCLQSRRTILGDSPTVSLSDSDLRLVEESTQVPLDELELRVAADATDEPAAPATAYTEHGIAAVPFMKLQPHAADGHSAVLINKQIAHPADFVRRGDSVAMKKDSFDRMKKSQSTPHASVSGGGRSQSEQPVLVEHGAHRSPAVRELFESDGSGSGDQPFYDAAEQRGESALPQSTAGAPEPGDVSSAFTTSFRSFSPSAAVVSTIPSDCFDESNNQPSQPSDSAGERGGEGAGQAGDGASDEDGEEI